MYPCLKHYAWNLKVGIDYDIRLIINQNHHEQTTTRNQEEKG